MSRAELFKQLRNYRKTCVEELSSDLLRASSSNDEISAKRLRLESVDKILVEFKPSLAVRLLPVLVVGVATALVLTILSNVNASFLSARIEVEARAVTIGLRDAPDITNLAFVRSTRIEGATWIGSPLLPQAAARSASTLSVESPGTRLERIDLGNAAVRGAELDLERSTDTLRLSIRDTPATFHLNVSGDTHIFLGNDDPPIAAVSRSFVVPEPLQVGVGSEPGNGASRSELIIAGHMATPKPVVMTATPRSLIFVQRTPRADEPFSSSIVTGKIVFAGIDRVTRLEEGDALQIENLEAARGRFAIGRNISAVVSGTARDIRVRRGSVVESISPSLLEFFSKNHLVKLLWAAAVFVSGMLWTASRFFAR